MIIKDTVFDSKRYWSPYGTVAPAVGLPDVSRYETDLAFAGTAAWEQLPSGLWVLALDGNSDYASLVIANWRDIDGAGTIEAWVKTADLTNSQTIFASSDTGTDTNFLQLRLAATTGFLEIVQRDGGALNQITGDVAIVVGQYSHVVVTGDTVAGAYILYVNGVVQGLTVTAGGNTGNWFDAIFDVRDNITMGAWINNSGTEQFFNGSIAPPKGYSYVLTPDQINAIYASERHWFA